MIRQIQNLGDAPIVGLEPHHPRPRMALRETQDVLHFRAPPRIDALGIIPHRHDLMVPSSDRIHKVGLQPVRVLILIHQHMLESPPILLPQLPLLLQKTQRQGQQIVIIHGGTVTLSALINLPHLGNPAFKLHKIPELVF